MAITMKDLAYMAGVSRATIDRVLNKRGNVNKETERRILALANSMGYRPNIVAQALCSPEKTFRIGIILAYVNHVFHRLVLDGVNEAIGEYASFGLTAIVRSMYRIDVEQQLTFLEELEQKCVNIIVLMPINDARITIKLHSLQEKGIKIIFLTSYLSDVEPLSFVGVDHEQTGRLSANLIALATKDKAKITACVGFSTMPGQKSRLRGLETAIAQRYPNLSLEHVIEVYDDNWETYSKIKTILCTCPEINFFYFAGGGVLGCLHAIQENGGLGIKVIAHDVYDEATEFLAEGNILFAAIQQAPREQGYTSVKAAIDYLLHHKTSDRRKLYIKPNIVISESLNRQY